MSIAISRINNSSVHAEGGSGKANAVDGCGAGARLSCRNVSFFLRVICAFSLLPSSRPFCASLSPLHTHAHTHTHRTCMCCAFSEHSPATLPVGKHGHSATSRRQNVVLIYCSSSRAFWLCRCAPYALLSDGRLSHVSFYFPCTREAKEVRVCVCVCM